MRLGCAHRFMLKESSFYQDYSKAGASTVCLKTQFISGRVKGVAACIVGSRMRSIVERVKERSIVFRCFHQYVSACTGTWLQKS